jgi:cobalt-zinc-cadmium efflux system membrane fusion protein
MKKAVVFAFAALLLVACSNHPRDKANEPESPTIAISRWSEKTELFMEHPPLVAGEKARFAIHFTDLKRFAPLTEGKVAVELRRGDSTVQTFTAEGPSRPGIFGVDVQPREAGEYTMVVHLNAKAVNDVHTIDGTRVFADGKAAEAVKEEPKSEEIIPFLKEQQWKLEFGTALAATAPVRESIRVTAEVRPRAGGEAEIAAPVSGRLVATAVPALGSQVSQGQVLARLIPHTSVPSDYASIASSAAQAGAAYTLAKRDRERAERLLAARAVPAKRVDEARAAEAAAEAQLNAANTRRQQDVASRTATGAAGEGAFLLRAPLSGVIAEQNLTPGASAEEGQRLFRVVGTDVVQVVANVPESELPRLRKINGAELEVAGKETPIKLGGPLSVGRVVDPKSRTVSVVYEVANRDGALAVGQAAFLRLFTGETVEAPVIPDSSVVDDAGRPVVFVQLAGESFARRPVRLGNREAGRVQILEGVKPGERVVTKGAYLIRLAALSPQIPAHGHVH